MPRIRATTRRQCDSAALRTAGAAQESLRPYFCLIGQSRRRALSRLTLSGQELSGAKRWLPVPPPPRPSAMR